MESSSQLGGNAYLMCFYKNWTTVCLLVLCAVHYIKKTCPTNAHSNVQICTLRTPPVPNRHPKLDKFKYFQIKHCCFSCAIRLMFFINSKDGKKYLHFCKKIPANGQLPYCWLKWLTTFLKKLIL